MSNPLPYSGPGKYVAICNTTNFDGHYIKVFEMEDLPENEGVSASWYFLNVVDFVACVEFVLPLELFKELPR